MKRSFITFLVVAGLVPVASRLAPSAQAQSTIVYAAEYNQSTNRFGTIDLLNGKFTQISSVGSSLINDIAYCPTNGLVYGISNSSALVTFNKTNGAITKIANLSVSGIQSLAFRPSDAALFGATQTRLYTINPANGTATSVGLYGSPTNLNSKGQNIRFAQDGKLYLSNTSTNTDIYRINTTNGSATWMGEAVGYPYLMLENASSNLYSVFINLGAASNQTPKLVSFDLSSFVVGGTNANGSTHQITVKLVGAGTNFPANFNFSGDVPQAVTNLTVPVSATSLSNQTTVVGSNVAFSTVASGTGPYSYSWLKNGTVINGQTNSSLALNNVTTADAATYSVIVGGALGTVTNTATLTVNKATASITLGSLSQTYDGSAKAATATTVPSGLAVSFTYNGSATVPTGAGSYVVVGTINDANYQGSATNTLVIGKASSSITLGSLSQTYDGSAKAATATTVPSGLAVSFTYNGSATVPTGAGSYVVVGTINDANYQGSATNTLVIGGMSLTVTNLLAVDKVYDGSTNVALDATDTGLAGALNDDNVILVTSNAVAYFMDKQVGTNKPVTVIGLALAGPAAANYILVEPTNLTASVAPAELSVAGVTVASKVYDGMSNAQLNGTANLQGVVNGDDVNLVADAASAAFASPNVGSNIGVAVSGYAITGADAGNYTLAQPSGFPADITAATLTITALPNDKTYDGNTTAAAVPAVSGLQGSDTVTGLAEVYDTKNAGTGKTLSVSAYTVNDGNGGNNYSVNTVASTAGEISAASLTITAVANSKTYDGNTTAAAVPAVSGLQGSDTVTGLAEVYDTKNAGTGKTLSVSAYTVNDGNGGNNYTVNAVASSAGTIDPAVLTVTADDKTKVYGTPNPSLTASYQGFVGGENAGVLSSPVTLQTTATTACGVGTYPITPTGAAAANYVIQYVDGTLRVIAAPQLTGASVSVSGTQQFVVSWQTFPNQTYQLECTADLAGSNWAPVGSPIAGTGTLVSVTNNMLPQCFFRVLVQ
ncbi:MAG TPA: YDG domain-containing protein [Candidatus Acidoferrum sp.]|nr:YDG domain-containing protein [Candidatus Acidoferrum sp.]